MEELTPRKRVILDALDEQIAELEAKLKKVNPLIQELNVLKQTRRTLLSERATTSGGGNSRVQLTMEEVVHAMNEHPNGMTPTEIAEATGAPGGTVRSHLNRGKGTRYAHHDGLWFLTEQVGTDD